MTQETDVLTLPWTPFFKCTPDSREPEVEIFKNSRYQVHVRRFEAQDNGPDLIHLSIKRIDQKTFIPYRDKMRIKDALVGAECEGVELLPARSREMDTANQYHLWIVDSSSFRFPFGWATRCVSDISINGAVQEPWPPDERPDDCLTLEEVQQLYHRYPGTL